ncbi:MAG: RluA family pseudouridine synthase [Alphaproteobacteria bacterium]
MSVHNSAALPVPAEADGLRLDRFLLEQFPFTRFNDVQRWCRTGQIRLNGNRVKPNQRLEAGQEVRLPPFLAARHGNEGEGEKPALLPLTAKEREEVLSWMIYQDAQLIAINKPAGLPAQAGSGHVRSADRLLAMALNDIMPAGGRKQVRLLHRLDKVTSGVLLFATTRTAAEGVASQFRDRSMDKTYVAVVQGNLPEAAGVIRAPLMKEGTRIVVRPQGDSAETEYKVLGQPLAGFTTVQLHPKTGRMHQLRVHMAHLGCPMVGDVTYGWEGEIPAPWRAVGDNILLHAQSLTLKHPSTGESVTMTAPLPAYFPPLA